MVSTVTKTQIRNALETAGLIRRPVMLHTSLKSFGVLNGGAGTLLEAFRETACTLVVPAFTYECESPPPAGRWILQNGLSPEAAARMTGTDAFDGGPGQISTDMGAVPACVLKSPGCVRGNHPLNSFAALGPGAKEIIETQHFLNVYGPLKYLYSQRGAILLLMGVGLTRATAIHLAEELAGRRLFRRWARLHGGGIEEVEVGSCSDGFHQLDPSVRGIEISRNVGGSLWRMFPLRDFVDLVRDAVEKEPDLTRCADETCPRCRDAVKGGPLLSMGEKA